MPSFLVRTIFDQDIPQGQNLKFTLQEHQIDKFSKDTNRHFSQKSCLKREKWRKIFARKIESFLTVQNNSQLLFLSALLLGSSLALSPSRCTWNGRRRGTRLKFGTTSLFRFCSWNLLAPASCHKIEYAYTRSLNFAKSAPNWTHFTQLNMNHAAILIYSWTVFSPVWSFTHFKNSGFPVSIGTETIQGTSYGWFSFTNLITSSDMLFSVFNRRYVSSSSQISPFH